MAATSTTLDVQARDGSRPVDEILDEIDRLAAADLTEQELHAALMPKIALLGCPAAAVWTVDGEDNPRLAWHSNNNEIEETDQSDIHKREAVVLAAVNAGQPKVVEPSSPGNGTGAIAGRSVIAPWSAAITTRGAVQTWLPERTNAAAISGYLRVLSVVAEVVGTYLDRQQQRRTRRQFELLSRLDAFVRGLYENLDLNQVAYKIANDGRILIGCDRLTVMIRRGSRYKT